MSTTVTYKGDTITTVNNETRTLLTQDKWVEDNITITDNSQGGVENEIDPVFSASPAAGITQSDIVNWNSKSNFSGNYNDLTNKPTIPAAQVSSDWTATSGVTQILHKPTLADVATSGDYNDLINKPNIPTSISDLNDDSSFITTETDPVFSASPAAGITANDITSWNNKSDFSGSYNDLTNKPTIVGQVNSDWNANSGVAKILNKPSFADVAISGNYNDLSNTPVLDTALSTVSTRAVQNQAISIALEDKASKQYVDTAISNIPSPMVFKGSLGTSGTITTLPSADVINTGFTYKVIQAGTYASQTAEIGDIFISDGTTWILVPSGDDIANVVVTPVQSSGTKIAVVTVNNTSTDLYAPTPVAPPNASTLAPNMDGTAAAGTSTSYARADHIHPVDTSRASANDVSNLTTRVGSLETAIGTGGSVENKITAAIQGLDSSIAATSNEAISAITITDGKITTSSKITIPTYSVATTAANGLMSAADKAKINALSTVDNNTTYANATTASDGLMSSTDKLKLDNCSTGSSSSYQYIADGSNKSVLLGNISKNQATGRYSIAEGNQTTASGYGSHAEGDSTLASGSYAHAQGAYTQAEDTAHAEGGATLASGHASHAEGNTSTASGSQSHAEGWFTLASDISAHAEGTETQATSYAAHAEGHRTTASGFAAHAEGEGTIAKFKVQHVFGQYNIVDPSTAESDYGTYIEIVGNGTTATKSNARTLDWNGNETLAGKLTIGANPVNNMDVVTKQYMENAISTISGGGSSLSYVADGSSQSVLLGKINDNEASGAFSVAEGAYTKARGTRSHAECDSTLASGVASHAEGDASTASGDGAHAEGSQTYASGYYSHAEGKGTTVIGYAAHAEGNATSVSSQAAHAEGKMSIASGSQSHAEGNMTTASGFSAHSEGSATLASEEESHAEGYNSVASGYYSHAQGYKTFANIKAAHAEGRASTASGNYSHAEGYQTKASYDQAHAEGWQTLASKAAAHAEGQGTTASGVAAHAEGFNTLASTVYAHAEGDLTTASGNYSHSEGVQSLASGLATHAEGDRAHATTYAAHAEGQETKASGIAAHAEGLATTAFGEKSHAEGSYTYSLGFNAHSEGNHTYASGNYSHTEGLYTTASADCAHTSGRYTIATRNDQTVIGKYNKTTLNNNTTMSTDAAFVIGNGTSATRSDAFAVKWDGTLVFANGTEITPAQFAQLLALLS